MYSLLLMTALSSGGGAAGADAGAPVYAAPVPVVAAPVVSYGCAGSCFGYDTGGCWGSACYGSSCHGGWGSSCHGGAGCNGGRGGLFRRLFHRGGSSCHGSASCHGCFGSAAGCWGSSCHGCFGGHSCHGAAYYHQGCYGSMAPTGCWGAGVGYAPAPVIYGAPVAPVVMPPAAAPAPAPAGTDKKTSANITIELPAGATLYVDGQPTRGAGATRQFHTPELPAGQAFFYDMKAELVIDGLTVVEEMKVVVHAGDSLTKSFGRLIAAANGGAKAVAAK